MITNFEEITKELTKEERALVLQLINGFIRRTQENPIKSPEIVQAVNDFNPNLKTKFTGVRLRKLCNFIRSKGMIGLIATDKGYFASNNEAVILSQIQSLKDRAEAIMSSANGLEIYLFRLKKQKQNENFRISKNSGKEGENNANQGNGGGNTNI